jgi:Flp pilus assembly protein TadG
MIVPVLAFLLLGCVEIGRFVILDQKLSRTAVTLADLVAQSQTLTLGDFDNFFDAAGDVTTPFDFAVRGRAIISSVSASNGLPPRIDWQQSGGGALAASSAMGSAGSPAALPEDFIVRDGENAIVAEIFYDFDPLFTTDLFPDMIVYRRAFFRPRLTNLNVIAN